MSRKALTAAVVAATIAWSISLSAFLAPLTAKAAASGSLVKASLPAVYYVGADGKRYVFPNEKTYKTWYADFSGVQIISDAELASMMIGGNVTYRPGVKMVKIQTDPKTYAVSHNGTLRWVKTEALATALYGTNWNQQIDDVPDAFFTNYTIGADINSASDYSPAAETAAATSINQDKNLSGSGTGELSFSLAAGTPASATLPRGATGVNFLSFDVKNMSAAALSVDTIVVHRSGPGAPGDFLATYLFEGNTRLTSSRTVNSTTNDSTFTGLNLSLAGGQTRTLWLAADMSTTAGAGNVSAFEVTKVQAGSLLGTGAAKGADMTLSSATTGSLNITASGALTNPKVGQMGAKLGEFQLAAGSAEDVELRRVTLFQSGSISRSNLSNLVLKQGGSTIATASAVDSKDHIVFVLTAPMLLEKGATRTFEVYGDIGAGARANDTINLYAEENVDVWAVGKTYGYGVTVSRTTGTKYDGSTGGGCTSSNAPNSLTQSCTKVEGGQITITFNGPGAQDIPVNGKDKELFNFTMASQANVEVRSTSVTLTSTVGNLDNDTIPFYSDVKIVDTATGTVVAGPLDPAVVAGANTTSTLTFTDIYNLSAGQSRTFKITADVASATPNGNTVRATLNAFGGNSIRNLDNSTYIATTDIVPSSAIVGNVMTVKTPTLTVSVASTPVAQTYIQGSQGVQLGGFNLKAGDSQDIKVTSLTVTCFIDADTASDTLQGQDTDANTAKCSDDVLTAKLWNGSTQVGDTKSPTTSTADGNGGLLQFTNLNLTVAKGQTVTLTLSGNLSGSISNLNDEVSFRVVAAGDATAQDPDGNTVTPSGTFPVTGPTMTIAASGTITVALAPDDSESEAGLVVGGTSNAVLAKFRLTAQNEELKLTKARLSLGTAAAASGVTSMSLYDGSTLVGGPTAVDSDGHADFSGMNFVIPKDASKTITAKANLATVGPSGAPSGLNLQLTLCDGTSNAAPCNTGTTDVGTFEVRGTSAGSSTQLTSFTAPDLAARNKILRKTKPTVSIVALPSSTLTNGTVVISRFTVSADAAEQVSLKHLTFNVAINGTLTVAGGGADSDVREVGQSSNIAGAAAYTGTCNASGTCVVNTEFANEQTIAAGTSKTYELRAVLSLVDTAGESVSTSLLGDTAQVTGELQGTTAPSTGIDDLDGTAAPGVYNFIWSDNSSVPHNDTEDTDADGTDDPLSSNDWTNGTLVKILPSDVQTMTRS